MNKFLINRFRNNSGFTLLEILVVVSIIAVLGAVAIPRISSLFGGARSDLNVMSSFIAKTFDRAFIHREDCFLAIHCHTKAVEVSQEILGRENGISAFIINKDGQFEDSPLRDLAYKRFGDNFVIDEVLLPNGVRNAGTVLITFHADGYSENAIIHITVEEEPYSIIINKMMKEPRIVKEHVSFEQTQNLR